MIFAKYIRSNQIGCEEDGLTRGSIYQVKRMDKTSYVVYLEGFDKPYNRTCFEYYEAKKKNIKFED